MNSPRYQQGMTLLEVIIATALLAVIAMATQQALDTAMRSTEVSKAHIARVQRIDRAWLLIENDIRNAIGYPVTPQFSQPLQPLEIDFQGGDYVLSLLRAGKGNPLQLPRTEIERIAWRLEDDKLWRDAWFDPATVDRDLVNARLLLDKVEDVEVRVLSPNASSVSAGPWQDSWPSRGNARPGQAQGLPPAIEVTLTLEDRGELKRLFSLLPGAAFANPNAGNPGGAGNPNNPNNPNNPRGGGGGGAVPLNNR